MATLMAIGQLPADVVEERLLEARRTYKLNLGYAGLTALPPGFVDLVKKYNPHITELELSSNNLSDLPEEIEEFRYLRTLRLKYNQLKRLPAVVTRLPQLMVLELSGNQISSVGDNVGNMTMLRELDLSGNMLNHISDALCTLPKLEILELENNRLEILPDAIGELQSLVKLDLSTNSLRFLPASMGHFKKVQRIDCANNLLARVPPSMGHLKTLKEFNLRYNSLDDRYKAKVEEGLSRLLAFLREEEERERLEEIERLKPIGTPVGAYLEYRCKAEVGQVVKTDTGEVTVDNRCWIRHGHTLTQVGNMLVIFGGTLVKDGVTTNDVFWMTMDRMEWHAQPCKGEKPLPRYNHCAIFDEESNHLVIFGGRSAERKRLNDVCFLDLETFTWYKPSTDGVAPTPREQAVAAFWAGNMIIFGGHAIGGRTNDLFLLDLSSWGWSQPATTGTAPSPRQASAMCIGHGNLLYIHGGRNNFVLEDLHVLDFVSKTWTEVSCVGRVPPPRHSHLICMHKDQLYLFGGLDELGAQSFSMYCMHMPPGENYTTAKPDWSEWESELPYNKCRTCTFFNGALSVYQLGSNTLGRVNDEDAEKGLVFFDVFKTARLEGLKPRQLDEEELKPKNAKRMRVQHTINIASKMPRSFNVQNAQEAKVLAYVQDFQRIFEELYPHRRQLYLTPKNECGVHKFVCTTLRPSQLSYTELYNIDGCCSFVADFIAYEPLEDSLHPPEFLPSPMSVCNWQAGDCFDMAVVLCSLLIGVGYNAYVVVGYAPPAVTTNDQTRTVCPVLEKEARGAISKSDSHSANNKADADKEEKKPKYLIKPKMSLESKFLKDQETKAQKEEEEKMAKSATTPAAQPASNSRQTSGGGQKASLNGGAQAGPATEVVEKAAVKAAEPSGPCKTVHAWVLVMGGKRDVSEPLFLEPTTGRKYPIQASPYEGVEYLWNHQNFWVCMQMPLPHSDSRAHPHSISFELNDPSKWECVFEERSRGALYDPTGDDGEGRLVESRNASNVPSAFKLNMGGKPKTPSMAIPKTPMGGASGGGALNSTLGGGGLAASIGGSVQTVTGSGLVGRVASRKLTASMALPDGLTPPRTADSHADSHHSNDDGDGGYEQELVPDLPPSWVSKLTIPRDAFDMRCPRGSKLQLYHRCQHEIFALFGDCSRWDGMVERLVLYEDEDRTVVSEMREAFQRRKDKLRERRIYPQKDTTIEYFDAGSSFGLKDILTVKGEKRIINFYHTARLDGLVRREELEGKKIVETFCARDNHLIYRSATYLAEGPQQSDTGEDPNEDDTARRARHLKNKEAKKVLPIRKMTEKFARNPAVDSDADLAKRVFYLSENRIQLDYHFGDNRVTRSSRIFHKDGQSQIVQVNPLADRPQPSALLEEYQALLLAEKDCMQAIRDSEWEISEIIRTRTNQEQNITLETPYYDIVRIKAEESEEEEEEEKESTYDYLSPFLPNLTGMQQLTRDQALEVRERCLKALKDRLIERANIIQARLDEETAALAKRQQNFNRDRDQMTAEEEEEYERAVEESMFRIHILEKRLKRHEEQALHKYYELDHKLRSDTRLAALLAAA